MDHIPYGYRIENGKAVIDEKTAGQVRTLFEAYLAGDSMNTAAEKAGIQTLHSVIGRMLTNARYAGDEYYPAIIDRETLAAAAEERLRRAEKLGRIREPKEEKGIVMPTAFRMREGTEQFDAPFAQAESAYSLIESEVPKMEANKRMTVIPARKHARGATVRRNRSFVCCLLPGFHRQRTSRPPAMKRRLSITRPTSTATPTGCWPAYLPTTAFPAPTPRSARNSTA
jgi:hypothetical protein